jgi:hypothetical protein
VDTQGDVLVTGTFSGTVDFGGGPLTSAGSTDIFVLKLAGSDGHHLWSGRFGSTAADTGNAIAVAENNNFVVSGAFAGTVDFGGTPLTSASVASDVFLAKYAPNGIHLWSQRFGGPSGDAGLSVAVDNVGDIALTGVFQGTTSFGGAALTSVGNNDFFVAKYSGAGTHRWSQRFGGTGDDRSQGIAIGLDGQVAVTGFFPSTVDFGAGPITSVGGNDIFLLRLGP